jgi:hypothetical protein
MAGPARAWRVQSRFSSFEKTVDDITARHDRETEGLSAKAAGIVAIGSLVRGC